MLLKDEGRPFTYANQLECVNHLKVLYSKDMVLSVCAPGCMHNAGFVARMEDNQRLCKRYTWHVNQCFKCQNDNSIDLKFLLGILNSKVGNYLLKGNSFSKKDTFPQIRLHWLKQFPVKLDSANSLKNKIIELVQSIQDLKQEIDCEKLQSKIELLKSKINYLEEKIDEEVCKLYDLTEDEMKIVVGNP